MDFVTYLVSCRGVITFFPHFTFVLTVQLLYC